MKKIFNTMMALAVAAFAFTACEDVPEPYNNPYSQRGSDDPEEVIEPAGSGTAADPWNVAALLEACNGLEADAFLNDGNEVYVKGIVTETTEVSVQYGNATYYISDNAKGSNRFYVYRGKLLDGASVSAETDLQEGDTVIVCGKVKNYKGNTLEFDQGNYLVYLAKGNGETPEKPDTKTVGTKDAPKSVADALTAIDALEKGATTAEFWYIKGKVKQIKTSAANIAQYKNIDYIITDDGNNELTVFRGKNLDNTDFTAEGQLNVDDEVVVYGQLTKYENTNTGAIVPEVAQGNYIVKLTKGGDQPGGEVKTVTVAEFNAAAESNDVWYQLTGTVKNLKDNDLYGNFDLEDATGSVYVYGLLSEKGGEKKLFQELAAAKGIKEGSKITIIGNRGSYNGKIEVMNAYFVSIDNGGGDTPTPSGTGTLDKPLTASQAYDIVAAMEAGVISEADYYVKGKICSVKYTFSAQYGTATFNISDDGTTGSKEFIAYSCYYFDNNSWKEGDTQIEVGDEVIVCGKVVNYSGNTPEFASKKNWLVSLNGKTGGSDVTPGGEVGGNSVSIDFTAQGFENQQEITEVTLSDGTKLTFNGGENNNTPKYYNSGTAVRMYPKNFFTATASKKIASITLNCSANNAEGQVTANPGTVAVDGMKVTVSGINATSTTITNAHTGSGAASQLRISSLTVTYAE